MTGPLSVSVIINTLDRADSLDLLLRSLRQQWYDHPFEVVVVTGPCTDHTDEVMARWRGLVKHEHCPIPNLSQSRNIGIAASAGDVVVFVDDDAVPETRWLAELIAPLEHDAEVIASGGYVWDHTGTDLQCRFNRCDRLGRASFHAEAPLDLLCFPGSTAFPYVPGGNGAWRRQQLIDLGAFDEHYEYYLDEVDVAVRAIDRGWRLAQVAGAAIHHKFLPSSVRTSGKVLTNRYPVLKNKLLFGLLNGRRHHSLDEIMGEAAHWATEHRHDVLRHISAGNLGPEMLERFDADVERALTDALADGLDQRRRLGGPAIAGATPEALVPFEVIRPSGPRRRYVFVTQSIPPDPIGGIGRYMLDTARGLSAAGHEVRLLTDGADHDTIDLEDGVWIHRLVKPDRTDEVPPVDRLPERMWANAVRVADEVDRLHEEYPVDAVYAAVWDVEALAVQERRTAPVVVALVTSLALALESDPTWAQGDGFMEDFAEPVVVAERRYLAQADLVHAISETILREVERSSGVALDRARVVVAGLGTADPRDVPASQAPHDHASDDEVRLLFVGKFERRKGIDVLLGALAEVMPARPALRATLLGRNTLVGPGGRTWMEWLDSDLPGGEWRDRLDILGEVPDEVLDREYRRADLFVAPSRFESFGLIYIEAMAHGLPVVGLAMGSAPEVVDPTCGVLVADDVRALADAIRTLVDDPDARTRLGTAGRARFEQQFTVPAMVERTGEVLARAAELADGSMRAGAVR